MKKTFGGHHRLCRSKEFQTVFRQGRSFQETYCKLYIYPNRRPYSRLGVIISKKAVPLSTHRHQFKRVVRESFRLSAERSLGDDMIIMLKKQPKDKVELRSVLTLMWQKVASYHKHSK